MDQSPMRTGKGVGPQSRKCCGRRMYVHGPKVHAHSVGWLSLKGLLNGRFVLQDLRCSESWTGLIRTAYGAFTNLAQASSLYRGTQ